MFEFNYLILNILFELGIHVGSSCTYNLHAWHMYILGKSYGRFAINLTYTLIILHKVFKLCVLLFLNNRKIFIADNFKKYTVNTLQKDLKDFAKTYRQISSITWYPGLLTNIKFFAKLKHQKAWKKLHFNYGRSIPSVVFLFSLNRCYSATHEALKLKLPLICVVDTVADPSYIDYPIFSNTCNLNILQFYIIMIKCAWYVANILKVTKKSPYMLSWISMKNKFEILREWVDHDHFTHVSSEYNPLRNFKKRLKRNRKLKIITYNIFNTKKKKYFDFFDYIVSNRKHSLITKYKKFYLYRRLRSVKALRSYFIKTPIKRILKNLAKQHIETKSLNKKNYSKLTQLFIKNEKLVLILLKKKKINLLDRITFSILYFFKKTYFFKNLIQKATRKYFLNYFLEIFNFLLAGMAKFALTTVFLKEDLFLSKRYKFHRKQILGKVA
jgi:ribosomal protein S2